jgi:hypothetical protein
MLMIREYFKRRRVAAVLAAMLMVCVPVPSAHAASPQDPPPPQSTLPAGFRLELAWNRQQTTYARLSFLFDHAEDRIGRAQSLIDRAQANGKDVSSIQSALDALSAAIKEARPAYEGCKGIVSAHQGFDANGHVTDITKAAQTVQDMGDKLRQIRGDLMGSARALRDAIRTFRMNNAPAPQVP